MATVPKKPFKKATHAETNARINTIQQMLLDGFTRSHILQNSTVLKWKLAERQLDTLISRANERINEINTAAHSSTLALLVSNQWDLFRVAKSQANLAVARQILMDIAKMRGLGATNLNLTVEDKRELATLSDEELSQFYSSDSTED